MNEDTKTKLLMAAVLFLVWVLLVVNHVDGTGADKLIDFIYTSLLAIGGHTIYTHRRKPKSGDTPPSFQPQPEKETK